MNRKLFTFLAIWLLSVPGLLANSVMGGEITYRSIGNDKYEVYVKIFRDCNGIQLSQSTVVAKCSTATINITNQTKVGAVDITPVGANCPTQSRCSGSFIYGYEEHTWKMELDLSAYANSNFCEWELSWEQCCRNGNITTGPGGQNFYISASLNRCLSTPNSSQIYDNPPVMLICHNQDFMYNMGAKDTVDNGDSVSYHLVHPLVGQSSVVNYTGQFAPTRPISFMGFPSSNLGWPAGFRLDPLTGDLMFRPTVVNQVGVIAIETREWRTVNGSPTVIGKTRRDFMAIIISCPNNVVPRIDPPYSSQFCSGVEKCISINTNDNDNNDTVRISWNAGIKGATFTNNNGQVRLASGQVCWTPSDSDVRTLPYTFTITAKDDACTLNGVSVRSISIFVRESPKAELSSSWLACGDVAYTMTQLNSVPGYSYRYNLRDSNWNILETRFAQTDTMQVPPGKHYLELLLTSSTPCPISIVDTLIIQDYVQVSLPTDTTVCFGETLNLTAAVNGGQTPYNGKWIDAMTNQDLNITAPIWSGQVIDSLNLRYQVSDGIGCTHSDSIAVRMRALPKVDLGPDQAYCAGDSIQLDRGVDSLQMLYQWSSGDTGQYLWVSQVGDTWLEVTDSFGCINSDTLSVQENAPSFDQAIDSAVCAGGAIQFVETDLDSIWYFELNPSPVLIGQGLTQSFAVLQTTNYRAIGNKTLLGKTCTVNQDFTLTAWALPVFNLPADFTLCEGDSNQVWISLGTASTYQWNDNVSSNQRWLSDSGTYILQITDTLGCQYQDSVSVLVNKETLMNSGNQIACLGDQVSFNASGVDSVHWYDEATYVQGVSVPVFKGAQFDYVLMQENNWLIAGYKTQYGQTCQTWDTVEAKAHPNVVLQTINGDFSPVDSVNSYTYSVNGNGLSVFFWTVDQGTILSGQGTSSVEVQWNRTDSAEIRLQAWTPEGCETEVDGKVFITLTGVSSPGLSGVKIYPNPFSDYVNIEMPEWKEVLHLELVNQLGQVMKQIDLSGPQQKVSLAALPAGVYYLRIQGNSTHGIRLVKF